MHSPPFLDLPNTQKQACETLGSGTEILKPPEPFADLVPTRENAAHPTTLTQSKTYRSE
jgi:hypothetical protein